MTTACVGGKGSSRVGIAINPASRSRACNYRLIRRIGAGVDRWIAGAFESRIIALDVGRHAAICGGVAWRRQIGPVAAVARILECDAVPTFFQLVALPVGE